jgi:hypothetical protein
LAILGAPPERLEVHTLIPEGRKSGKPYTSRQVIPKVEPLAARSKSPRIKGKRDERSPKGPVSKSLDAIDADFLRPLGGVGLGEGLRGRGRALTRRELGLTDPGRKFAT